MCTRIQPNPLLKTGHVFQQIAIKICKKINWEIIKKRLLNYFKYIYECTIQKVCMVLNTFWASEIIRRKRMANSGVIEWNGGSHENLTFVHINSKILKEQISIFTYIITNVRMMMMMTKLSVSVLEMVLNVQRPYKDVQEKVPSKSLLSRGQNFIALLACSGTHYQW